MEAYATAERRTPTERSEARALPHPTSRSVTPLRSERDSDLLGRLVSQIADLVVDRLAERTQQSADHRPADWMDAREAAEYLGMHRDTVRKLAAQRVIPTHQDGPRCKLYFHRHELDDWRRSARPRLRAVS